MSVHYKQIRFCKTFYCDQRGDRYCCASCAMRRDCDNPCLNHPVRCKLEDIARRDSDPMKTK